MLTPLPASLSPLLLVSSSTLSFLARAQPSPPEDAFLNAYRAPLSALSAPLSHYFLEFPLDHHHHDRDASPEDNDDRLGPDAGNSTTGSETATTTRPKCEDGSPFGLLFRRGTDEHYRKLLVEFEGAGGTRAFGSSSTPWEPLRSYRGAGETMIFPPLGTCQGVSEGLLSLGAGFLGFGTGDGEDVPIFLRGGEVSGAAPSSPSSSAAEDDAGTRMGNSTNNPSQERSDGNAMDVQTQGQQQQQQHRGEAWWELLGGDRSSVRDWSYLLVPHCTPSSPSLSFANVREATARVSSWYGDDAGEEGGGGGLDALVVASGGGRIGGGCSSSYGASDGLFASLSFAKDVGQATMSSSSPPSSSKALVVMDSAAAWDRGGGVTWRSPSYGDATLSDLVREALASDKVEVAWTASAASAVGVKEDVFLRVMTQSHRDSFHVHRPLSSEEEEDDVARRSTTCPRYAFPDASADDAFVDFIGRVVKGMPWNSDDGSTLKVRNKDALDDDDALDDNQRLSFLSIFLILLGAYLTSWAAYLAIKSLRSSETTTPSPHDLWFMALTKFPVLFLLASVTIPVVLSYVAYQRDGVSVNLDFDSYLDIDTKDERTATRFKALVEHQKESLEEEQGQCEALYTGNFSAYDNPMKGGQRRASEAEDEGRSPGRRRGLQEYGKREGRSVVSLFYQNRNGGTVFTPEVLRSIREFETFLMTEVPGLDEFCYGDGEICYPFNSIMPYFYPDGENLVEDVDQVLRSFPGSKIALAKMDKYFSKDNLGSNVTLTNVMLNDVNGSNRGEVRRFLESLHRVLWDVDQSGKYPDLVISWSNSHMYNVEAADALEHDFKWSLAALTFIGLMVFVKVRNVFEVLAGVLGLVLSFTSALYWQHHFDFEQLTAMHVAGIFVMLGIGADDIFLTIDSFEHTKVDFANSHDNLDDPEIVKRRMILSYGTAGSMLLVSSVTTAICFFSNIFSALVAIADFGSYMGMVVVLNYVHVMTILPSAIIVYEVHIKPLQRKIWWAVCCCSKNSDQEESRVPSTHEILDAETGIVQSASVMERLGHENGEVEHKVAATRERSNSSIRAHEGVRGAVTGRIASSSQVKDDWQDNDRCGRTPETASHSASEATPEESEAFQQTADDYKFLNHTDGMSALDRYFVQRHAPFVFAWRKTIVFTSIFVAITMGVFAWLNFKLYDGTIIVFKEQYNLGRVQRIVDDYFPEGLVRKYTDEGLDFVGGDGDVSISAGDLDNTFGGSDVFDVLADASVGGGSTSNAGGGSSANSPPTTSAPATTPATAAPSISRPSTSPFSTLPDSQEQNTTGVVSAQPPSIRPTTRPPSPPASGVGSNPNPIPGPSGEWYPNWTGDTRGCLKDGQQPDFTSDSMLESKVECCDEYFALDENPGNCLEMDTYIEVFKCDGAKFNRDSSALAANSLFYVCIKSRSSIVDFNYLNSMVIAQGNAELTLISSNMISFPSFTSSEVVEAQKGVVISTFVPTNVFDYNTAGASVKVAGVVVVKTDMYTLLGAEAPFELNINLRQEIAPQVTTSPVSGPTVPGPTIPGPTVPSPTGPTIPSPTVPGPSVPGPTVPGPTVPGPTVPGPTVPGPTITGPTAPGPNPNNTPSVPSPSRWYPDWNDRVCLNDNRYPAYFDDSPVSFLFDNLIQCCAKSFVGDQRLCFGIDTTTAMPATASPAISPTTSPSENPSSSPSLSPTVGSMPPTISPSFPPTNAPTKAPTIQPSASPVKEIKFSCPPGLSGKYCLQTSGVKKTYQKREYYAVSIVWGMMPIRSDPDVWVVKDKASKQRNEVMKEALGDTLNNNYIDPSDPFIQEWLLKMVTLARNDAALRLHPQLTWIEAMKDVAVEKGIGFPIPKSLFIGVIELIKTQSTFFSKLVEKEIATKKPGIKGEFLYTGLTVLSEVPAAYTSDLALKDWTNFTNSFNEMLPENLPPTDAQSDVFMDSLRTTAIVDSTLSSYFFANGLYVAIMLFFTGNLLLTLMVMLSLLLILLAFAGLTFFAFQIEFGPVESLGASIFVGLSANYLLHIVHSYHTSNIKERDVKIQRAVFITGSPILWSALSTIGGSLFLFACRTWLLTELGLLICTIIGLSLMCSVGFLLALLAFIGPLPIGHKLHSCDLMIVFRPCYLRKRVQQAGRAERDLENASAEERNIENGPVEDVNDVENAPAEVAETDSKIPLSDECSISGETAASF